MNIEEIVEEAISSARAQMSSGAGLGSGSVPGSGSPPGPPPGTGSPPGPGSPPGSPQQSSTGRAEDTDLSSLEADVLRARKVLQTMKSRGISVDNTKFFNLLISDHASTGDMPMARGMLQILRQLNEELPSQETFFSLACGYAKQGDWDSLQRVIAESEEEQVPLGDMDFLELVFVMCEGGHKDHIEDLLSLRTSASINKRGTDQLIVRLVNRGHDDVAAVLSDAETEVVRSDGSDEPVLGQQVTPPRQDSDSLPPHQAEDDPGFLPAGQGAEVALHHHQPGPRRGFINAGQTCYLNATIQVRISL